ncbi:MAG: alpha/beta fold hydrolase, partial [Myxococcota bacterium]
MGTRDILRLLSLAAVVASSACRPAPTVNFVDAEYPWPVERAEVGGTSLAYADLGQGEHTLVLIHGLGSYMPAWKNNASALARQHRVIVVDLPGFGKSDKPDASYTMDFFAGKVLALMDELGVQRPVLVGHSMGGQIAMRYALSYPERHAGLVLTSPAGLETFEDPEAKWLANAVTPAFTCGADDEAIFVRHAGNFHRMPEDAKFMVDDRVAVKGDPDFEDYCVAVSRSVAGMLDQPVFDELPQIDAPVLVLFGKSDNLIPNPFLHGGSTVTLAEKATEQFADAELVILPRAGHMAQFEAAEAWNDA